MMKAKKKDSLSNFTAQQTKWLDSNKKSNNGSPMLFEKYQKQMQDYIDNGTRLLIYKSDNTSLQNAVVVVLEHAYKRFATGYTLSKEDGVKTPYTLNYVSLADKINKTYIKVEED